MEVEAKLEGEGEMEEKTEMMWKVEVKIGTGGRTYPN